MAKTCFKKSWSHLRDSGGASYMPRLQTLRNSRHPNCSGKVGMRYFHRPRNKFYCPTVDADRLWSLSPDGIKDFATAYDGRSALLTGITSPCCPEIPGQSNFIDGPRY